MAHAYILRWKFAPTSEHKQLSECPPAQLLSSEKGEAEHITGTSLEGVLLSSRYYYVWVGDSIYLGSHGPQLSVLTEALLSNYHSMLTLARSGLSLVCRHNSTEDVFIASGHTL